MLYEFFMVRLDGAVKFTHLAIALQVKLALTTQIVSMPRHIIAEKQHFVFMTNKITPIPYIC